MFFSSSDSSHSEIQHLSQEVPDEGRENDFTLQGDVDELLELSDSLLKHLRQYVRSITIVLRPI